MSLRIVTVYEVRVYSNKVKKLRKKLEQLAEGIFDDRKPSISFSVNGVECTKIEIEVMEGQEQTGEFTIYSSEKLCGRVYSTYSRMECLTPQFEGEEVKIRYQFHSEGLIEGDVRKGEFVIVCEYGEYNLSFVVSVWKAYTNTSIGMIKNLSDFVNLAQKNMNEAYQVFYSMHFSYLLKEAGEKERLLYEAIRKEPPSMQAVEAYLVGIGKKQPVKVTLEEKKHIFKGVTFDCSEQIGIKKEHWGSLSCKVRTNASFIQLEKTSITEEDFKEDKCLFTYDVKADKLHVGNNFGQIFFEFPEQTLVCEIIVKTNEEEMTKNSIHFLQMKDRTKLLQLYVDYRTKKIVTGTWAKKSIAILNHLLEIEPEADIYRLMKVQIFLFNRQRQEASWIMNDYKRSCADKNTEEWGYYLYLCTLMEREETYVNKLAAEIEELFLLHSESSLLFWVLLFVREEYYESNAKRLLAIEQWIEKGNDSPFFYLEAFYLYCQEPYLIDELGEFELKILNWAAKQKAFSKEAANQIVSLAPALRYYNEKIFRILKACYETVESEEALTVICGYLIKGQKFAKKYHKWYALGVNQEIQITNLYEAYLLSADEESLKNLPKSVLQYLLEHSQVLDYKRLAFVYVSILNQKKNSTWNHLPKEYQNYEKMIRQFAIEQVKAGHIDENLAVIYRECFPAKAFLKEDFVEEFLSEFYEQENVSSKNKIPEFLKQEILKREILEQEGLKADSLEDETFGEKFTELEGAENETFGEEWIELETSEDETFGDELIELELPENETFEKEFVFKDGVLKTESVRDENFEENKKVQESEDFEKDKRFQENESFRENKNFQENETFGEGYRNIESDGFLEEKSIDSFLRAFAKVLFVHRLQVTGKKKFEQAVIVQKQWKDRQVVPIIEGVTYFQAYTNDYCILLLDNKGGVFAEENLYEEYPLLESDVEELIEITQREAEVRYLVRSFDKKRKEHSFTKEDEEKMKTLMFRKEVKEEWKSELFYAYLKEMVSKNKHISLDSCFKIVNYKRMSVLERCFMVEQLIDRQMFELAYEMFHDYGYDFVGKDSCVAICSYYITKLEGNEDGFLLGLASDTFSSGNYDAVTLEYLCQYYYGSTKLMSEIFLAAEELGVETYDLEERILAQMLYTSDYLEQADKIYEAYCKKNPNDLVSKAYLSYFAHLYLTKDMVTSKQVFLQIEHRVLLGQEIARVQNYALLKYYSEQKRLTDSEYQTADTLLKENTAEQIYFGFYKNLDTRLIRKYLLQNKYFVEYHSNPNEAVIISYFRNEEECLEEVIKEVYAGIFVKEFVLFFGDEISYYITEAEETERTSTLSGQITYEDIAEEIQESRYGMLNEICEKMQMQEDERTEKLMKEYSRKKQMTEELFGLL